MVSRMRLTLTLTQTLILTLTLIQVLQLTTEVLRLTTGVCHGVCICVQESQHLCIIAPKGPVA